MNAINKFGNLLLNILSIYESTTKQKCFVDVLRYWMNTKILTYLINDNNEIQIFNLSLKRSLKLYDLIM